MKKKEITAGTTSWAAFFVFSPKDTRTHDGRGRGTDREARDMNHTPIVEVVHIQVIKYSAV